MKKDTVNFVYIKNPTSEYPSTSKIENSDEPLEVENGGKNDDESRILSQPSVPTLVLEEFINSSLDKVAPSLSDTPLVDEDMSTKSASGIVSANQLGPNEEHDAVFHIPLLKMYFTA